MSHKHDASTDWRSVLREVEKSCRFIGEHELLRDLQRIHVQLAEKGGELDQDLEAEIVAFALREEKAGEESEWGVRFGPMLSSRAEDEHIDEWPRRTSITAYTVAHWMKRANESPHPVLRCRYARLAWDLAQIAPGITPDYRMAQIAVDSAIEISSGNCGTSEIQCIQALRIALHIAHQLNDTTRIAAVRDDMIRYEVKVAMDEKAGLWGFSFDCLVREELGNASAHQITRIVQQLEERLHRLADPGRKSIDPWKVEAAAQRLAYYHRRVGNEEDLRRVLCTLAAAFDALAENAEPMQAYALLEHSHSIMHSHGLTEEAGRIAVKLQDLGPVVRDSLKAVTVEGSIKTSKIKEAIESILDHELKEALERLAVNFIPQKDQVELQVRDYAEQYPLGFLFPVSIKDYLGRTVSRIGSLEEDTDGRIIHQMSQNLQFMGFLLRKVLNEAASRGLLNPDQLLPYLYESPVFRPEFREIIKHGVVKYLDGDMTSAIHILTPQVEGAIRTLLEKAHVPVLKPVQDGGGFYFRVLGDLLRDHATMAILGEDLSLYLRVLFSDRRGWNIRNRLCHALLPADQIGFAIADRAIHALLCLALVRKREGPEGTEGAD